VNENGNKELSDLLMDIHSNIARIRDHVDSYTMDSAYTLDVSEIAYISTNVNSLARNVTAIDPLDVPEDLREEVSKISTKVCLLNMAITTKILNSRNIEEDKYDLMTYILGCLKLSFQ